MLFDARKSLIVLAVLSIIVFFSSISVPQPKALLLGQIATDSFVNHRAVLKVSDCGSSAAPVVDSVKIDGDQTHFSVREIGLHDGFGSSEHLYIGKGEQGGVTLDLEYPTCVATLEIIGAFRADQVSKRSIIRVWGLRR